MIKISHIGFNSIHPMGFFADYPSGRQDYLFLLLRSNAKVLLEDEVFTVNSPAVILFQKGCERRYGYTDGMFVNDWFSFDCEIKGSENEIESLLKTLNISMQSLIFSNNTQTISELIRDLEYEFRQPGLFQKELIDAKVKALLYKMACICHQEKYIPRAVNQYRETFANIRNKIYQSHGADISIPQIAKEYNMSSSYFHYIYKRLFDISPGQDMIKSRIDYACILLRSKNFLISDIAEKCNYYNVEHFIRQFKQYMKCSPGEYRKSKLHI